MTILTIQSKAEAENKNVVQRRHVFAKRAQAALWCVAAFSVAVGIIFLIVVHVMS